MQRYSKYLFASLIATSISFILVANAKSTVYENVKHLTQFENEVTEYTSKHSGKVLMVYDIDDTLMETSSFFGGDTWYNWQRGRSITHKNGETVTINTESVLSCPFSKMGVFFDLGESHPVEKTTVETVNKLQQKFDTLVLTSRSPDYRSGTQRILKGAGFNFVEASLLPKDHALYYKFNDGKNARPLSYANGVVMSSGLNKGRVLRDILTRTNKNYDAVFFLDDSYHNIENMKNEWQKDETELFIFHYTHVEKVISNQDVELNNRSKQTFNTFIETAFPNRYKAFNEGKCY